MQQTTRGGKLNAACREAGAIMLKLAYNYTVEPHKNDPLIDLADTALDLFSRSAATGAYLVDVIPACKWLLLISIISDEMILI